MPLAYYKLVKSQHVTLLLKNGLKVKLRVHSTDLQAFVNVWILEEYKENNFEIKHNDTVLDVGAHIGLFTLYSSQFCKNGMTYAFEPIKENYDLLKENIGINNLTNVKTFNCAISDEKKKIRIYKNQEDHAAHSIYGTGPNFVEIEATTITDIINSENIVKCDFIKLDCEGAEYDIINSLSKEYFSKIEKICLEYHLANSKPHLLIELKKKLQILNYKIIDRSSIDGLGVLFASK